MKRSSMVSLCAALVVVVPTAALAHPGADHSTHHFASGFLHPFTGIDHILAMTTVGMWAAQLGSPARWSIPLGFVAMMIVGGLFAAAHVTLPFVESGILASTLVLGLLLLFSLRLPSTAAVALTGAFAIFHGYAHIAEITPGAAMFVYTIGFVAATLILLFAGQTVGKFLKTKQRPHLLRAIGGAVAAASVLLAIG